MLLFDRKTGIRFNDSAQNQYTNVENSLSTSVQSIHTNDSF